MLEKIITIDMIKDPNFMGSFDFINGIDKNDQPTYKEMTLTIKDVSIEEITDMELIKSGKKNAKGKQTKEACLLHFAEFPRPYVVKAKVVREAIAKATGTTIVNKWVGKKITMYIEKGVKAFGNITDAIRVRPFAPAPAKTYKCVDCGCEVEEKIAVYAEKKVGVVVCAECGKKRTEGKE